MDKAYRSELLCMTLFFSIVTICSDATEVKNFFSNIITQSSNYTKQAGKAQFKEYSKDQKPFATLIFCSDSRVQLSKFFPDAVNKLFIVRNAGNLAGTAAGSVEYGVNYLKTPIVIVMGHSECGAVDAALGDVESLSKAVRSEVKKVSVNKKENLKNNIVFNVNSQVEQIKSKYPSVTVFGLLYDFSNKYEKGHGSLIFVNIDGETDSKAIKASEYLKGLNPIILD